MEKLCAIIPELVIIINGTNFDTAKKPIVFEAEDKSMWFLIHRDKEVVEDYIPRI